MKALWHIPANTRFLEELPGRIQFHSSWEASYLLSGPSVSQHVQQVKIICVEYMEKIRGMLHNSRVKKSKYNAMYILHWIRLFNGLFLFLKAGMIQGSTRQKQGFVCLQGTASCNTTWLAFLSQAVRFHLNSLLVVIGLKKESHKPFR